MHLDFLSSRKSFALRILFRTFGLREMLEGRDYPDVDTILHFIAPFLDKAMKYRENHGPTKMHTIFSDATDQLMYNRCDKAIA